VKRFVRLIKSLLNAVVIAVKWLINLLSLPFRKVRQAATKDLVISALAGVAFIIASFISLNIKWEPPFSAYSNYLSLSTGIIGLLLLLFSLVGLIK